MPIQREYDLMTLSAQLRIMKMVEEWRKQFLGGRFAQSPQISSPDEDMVIGGDEEPTLPGVGY